MWQLNSSNVRVGLSMRFPGDLVAFFTQMQNRIHPKTFLAKSCIAMKCKQFKTQKLGGETSNMSIPKPHK